MITVEIWPDIATGHASIDVSGEYYSYWPKNQSVALLQSESFLKSRIDDLKLRGVSRSYSFSPSVNIERKVIQRLNREFPENYSTVGNRTCASLVASGLSVAWDEHENKKNVIERFGDEAILTAKLAKAISSSPTSSSSSKASSIDSIITGVLNVPNMNSDTIMTMRVLAFGAHMYLWTIDKVEAFAKHLSEIDW